MNRWLKGLNRIEFLVTEACTGACKHCSQGGSRGNRHIDQKLAADAVRKICSNWDIQSVMTFGGLAPLRLLIILIGIYLLNLYMLAYKIYYTLFLLTCQEFFSQEKFSRLRLTRFVGYDTINIKSEIGEGGFVF